jgi:hypothetical protein
MSWDSHTSGVATKRITLLGTPISFYILDQLAQKFNISFGSMVRCLSALITAVVSLLFMYIMGHTVLVG